MSSVEEARNDYKVIVSSKKFPPYEHLESSNGIFLVSIPIIRVSFLFQWHRLDSLIEGTIELIVPWHIALMLPNLTDWEEVRVFFNVQFLFKAWNEMINGHTRGKWLGKQIFGRWNIETSQFLEWREATMIVDLFFPFPFPYCLFPISDFLARTGRGALCGLFAHPLSRAHKAYCLLLEHFEMKIRKILRWKSV